MRKLLSILTVILCTPGIAEKTKPAPRSVRAAIAARSFAATLAEPGTEEFARLFRLAFAAAEGDASAGGGSDAPDAPRALSMAAKRGLVESDPRYQGNLADLSKDKEKIWGGRRVAPGDFPDAVAIRGKGGLCSGTLIASNAVITARHCLCNGVADEVILGDDLSAPRRSVPVDTIATDPGTQCARTLDFAVLFLKETITDVTPRAVARSEWIDSVTSVRAVGFGRTENDTTEPVCVKRTVDIPVASNACAGVVPFIAGPKADATYYKCEKGKELVAGAPALDRDTCNGDSGGPIYVLSPNGSDYYLAGITSRAVERVGNRLCGDGGIYVRASGDVVSWLSQHHVPFVVGSVSSVHSPLARTAATDKSGSVKLFDAVAHEPSPLQIDSRLPTAAAAATKPSSESSARALTVVGTVTQLPDGDLAIVPAGQITQHEGVRTQVPVSRLSPVIHVSNPTDVPEAAKTVAVAAEIGSTPAGYAVNGVQLAAETTWEETKQKIPSEISKQLNEAYGELQRLAGTVLTRGSSEPATSLAPALANVRSALVETSSQTTDPMVRRAVVRNYREIVRAEKAIYGFYDIYPTAAYQRIFEVSRSVGAIARRADDPFCSGVLIAPDLFLTAKHCTRYFPNEVEVRFNFDEDADKKPLQQDVYPVRKYEMVGIPARLGGEPLDFAVLRLERNSAGLPGDKWRAQCITMSPMSYGDPLYIIGHPLGLPRKVADNTHVIFPFRVDAKQFEELRLQVEAEYGDAYDKDRGIDEFLGSYVKDSREGMVVYEQYSVRWGLQPVIGADSDTFHGNSGSPVFDHRKHKIVGVFIGGAPDGGNYTVGWRTHEVFIPITAVIEQLDKNYPAWNSDKAVCIN